MLEIQLLSQKGLNVSVSTLFIPSYYSTASPSGGLTLPYMRTKEMHT